MAARPNMTDEMTVLAESLCERLDSTEASISVAKPRKRDQLEEKLDGYMDALALLFACGVTQYPVVHSAINTVNNRNLDAACNFYNNWRKKRYNTL